MASNQPSLPAEFNEINHTRGIVSMAKYIDPNSANGQFFIMLEMLNILIINILLLAKLLKEWSLLI
ncbi:MAG: peptidylprolyl isomerase [Candidatus Midichloria mitochondrii]|nr:peptidylprolyl isomerase [Candidatus Midichloria mitochondrii]MDJ1256681.1 peptidylprolyl isomerase [Candidatus Midichloria mitochondrii]MDJ1288403.1 peptidylprolyl isomerase [Candidatus Midichloria mitochondrii]MDJ1299243.1 peptidylprolyl isomerase [Candidatus Midichloria mitochondrii]MDJ1313369.1 peptidylprolyl isomerase [Candidatus Midichloria mitochondrii]MDJ1583941.1 peptidylprolyl isomerase [Candidatus Midichloria mitochondrii]